MKRKRDDEIEKESNKKRGTENSFVTLNSNFSTEFNFFTLPDELKLEIFKQLNLRDLYSASQACKKWSYLFNVDYLWSNKIKVIDGDFKRRLGDTRTYKAIYQDNITLTKKLFDIVNEQDKAYQGADYEAAPEVVPDLVAIFKQVVSIKLLFHCLFEQYPEIRQLRDVNGYALLHWMTIIVQVEAVELLLRDNETKKYLNDNENIDKNTPLHFLMRQMQLDSTSPENLKKLIVLYLQYKVDLTVLNIDGSTILQEMNFRQECEGVEETKHLMQPIEALLVTDKPSSAPGCGKMNFY